MNIKTQERCIEIARSLMASERTGRSFHMSFILRKKVVLVMATNDYRHQHLFHKFGQYIPTRKNSNYVAGRHSECLAVKQYLNKFGHLDVSGLTLFNVRIGYDGNPMYAAPCPNCQRNIIDPLNFKEICWTSSDSVLH